MCRWRSLKTLITLSSDAWDNMVKDCGFSIKAKWFITATFNCKPPHLLTIPERTYCLLLTLLVLLIYLVIPIPIYVLHFCRMMLVRNRSNDPCRFSMFLVKIQCAFEMNKVEIVNFIMKLSCPTLFQNNSDLKNFSTNKMMKWWSLEPEWT